MEKLTSVNNDAETTNGTNFTFSQNSNYKFLCRWNKCKLNQIGG